MGQCTLNIEAMLSKQNISQLAVYCRYLLQFSLQGVLLNSSLNYKVAGAKNRNKKRTQG